MKKKSKLYSILKGTCPRCHQGQVFQHKRPYQSILFGKMNNHCSVCGQSFEPEPGFYQGAMYVSYAFSLGLCFVVGVLMTVIYSASFWALGLTLTVLLLILLPTIFRLSRMIWLNMFVEYQPLDVPHLQKLDNDRQI